MNVYSRGRLPVSNKPQNTGPVDRSLNVNLMERNNSLVEQRNLEQLTKKRQKKGECVTCGQRTHRVVRFPPSRTPLTIEGKVITGICLKCHPIEGYARRQDRDKAGPSAYEGHADRPKIPNFVDPNSNRGARPDDDGGTLISGITNDPVFRCSDSNHDIQDNQRSAMSQSENAYDTFRYQPARFEAIRQEQLMNMRQDSSRNNQRNSADAGSHVDSGIADPGSGISDLNNELDGFEINDHQDHDHYTPITPFSQTQRQSFVTETSPSDNLLRSTNHYDDSHDRSLLDSERLHQRQDETDFSVNSSLALPSLHNDDSRRRLLKYTEGTKSVSSQCSAENDNYLPNSYAVSADNNLESFLERERLDHVNEKGYFPPSVSSGRSGNLSQEEKIEIEEMTFNANNHRSIPEQQGSTVDNSVAVFVQMPSETADDPAENLTSHQERTEGPKDPSTDTPDIHSQKKKLGSDDTYIKHDAHAVRVNVDSDGKKSFQQELQKPFDEGSITSSERKKESIPGKMTKKKPKLADIPIIIKCMQIHKEKDFVIRSALEALFDLATLPDIRAKEMIIQHDGIPSILENIWSHLDNRHIQIAAFNALWALFSMEIGYQNENSDPLIKANLNGITDAVMISMQTNSHYPTVQQVGCGALSCIASSKARGIDFEDAENPQIIATVLNSMREHPKHIGVQEWALRAIFNHCLNYGSSKSYFCQHQSRGDADLIYKAMKQFSKDIGIQEWACRLYCCLCSNEEVTKNLCATTEAITTLISTLEKFSEVQEAELVLEAAFSAVANFCSVSDMCVDLAIELGIIKILFRSMAFFRTSGKVQIETCVLISSLCISKQAKALIVDSRGVETILNVMEMFPDDKYLQEEASRALSSICHEFPTAKDKLASKESIDTIMRVLRRHIDIEETVENTCELLCTLTVSKDVQSTIFKYGFHHVITEILVTKSENIRISQFVCCILRNLSTNKSKGYELAKIATIRQVVRSMIKHNLSEEIQIHSCVIFWNLSAELRRNADTILHTKIVDRVISSLQNFPASSIIQRVACGSLWSLMVNLEEVKLAAIEAGGIDALIVALVMYQTDLSVLENACGALSSLSVNSESLNKIVIEGGIGYIIESMRNNSSSTTIIIYGSIFLRNASIANKNYAEEASACASTIIRGMNEHLDDIYLQKECIGAVRTLAIHSETCKERILGANGLQTVQHVMNIYRSVEDIQRLGSATLSLLSNS